MTSERQEQLTSLSVGNEVRIRNGFRSPYAGHQGVIFSVDLKDQHAPYLVRFHDGIQFRYHAREVEFPQTEAGNTAQKFMKSGLYRIFAAFLIFAVFILIGCAIPIPSPAPPHIAVQASFLNNTHPHIYPSDPHGLGTRQ
jgi:hypothetical protein